MRYIKESNERLYYHSFLGNELDFYGYLEVTTLLMFYIKSNKKNNEEYLTKYHFRPSHYWLSNYRNSLFLLSKAESGLLNELIERYELDRNAIVTALRGFLIINVFSSVDFGDKQIELCGFENSEGNENVMNLCRDISCGTIFNENHGFGYHLHIKNKKDRQPFILTFDKKEPCCINYNDSIYWAPHNEGNYKKTVDIHNPSKGFLKDIREVSRLFLGKFKKSDFLNLPSDSSILYDGTIDCKENDSNDEHQCNIEKHK
ncbi:hypothetical protein [Serratia fonticola]